MRWYQVQPYSQEIPSSELANYHSNTAKRLCTTKPENKEELSTSAIQHARIQPASSLLVLHFMESITLMTSNSTNQLT